MIKTVVKELLAMLLDSFPPHLQIRHSIDDPANTCAVDRDAERPACKKHVRFALRRTDPFVGRYELDERAARPIDRSGAFASRKWELHG